MDNLEEIRKNIVEFRKNVIGLSLSYCRLPNKLVQINCQELIDETHYLHGYIDCMSHNSVELLPEPIYNLPEIATSED